MCQGNNAQPFIYCFVSENYQFLITTDLPEEAEVLAVGEYDGDLRFKIARDDGGHVQKLELFSDWKVVSELQRKSNPLRLLKEALATDRAPAHWPHVLAHTDAISPP